MKRILSTLLSLAVAVGCIVPNVYAQENDTALQTRQTADTLEDDDLFPEVIHISGDKLMEMVDSYDEEHPEEFFDASGALEAPIREYADTNTYTEYVYIRSVQDLLAIDGHDGGYYELASDIDLKGMEWPGISLTNAVFDGKGHYIYNLTQTSDHCYGLFNIEPGNKDANVYVSNVNLSEININVSSCTGDEVVIAVMGGAGVTPENCYISGKIKTTAVVKNLMLYVYTSGINCDARVDISVGGSGTDQKGRWYVYPMIKCTHS